MIYVFFGMTLSNKFLEIGLTMPSSASSIGHSDEWDVVSNRPAATQANTAPVKEDHCSGLLSQALFSLGRELKHVFHSPTSGEMNVLELGFCHFSPQQVQH